MIDIKFNHGLGDAANFAQALSLWISRGHQINVECTPDKAVLFQAVGCTIVNGKHHAGSHPFNHAQNVRTPDFNKPWQGSKIAHNLTAHPMPPIGKVEDLWNELLNIKLSLEKFVSEKSKNDVDQWLATFAPGPVVLVHTRGNTNKYKNINDEMECELYRELIHHLGATVVLLDWDNRVSRIGSHRLRHMLEDFRGLSLPELWYLMEKSSLIIGVDSGILHFARWTNTPALGVWNNHKPSDFAIPSDRAVHIAAPGEWSYRRRAHFNIVPGERSAAKVVEVASQLVREKDGGIVALWDFLGRLRTKADCFNCYYADRDKTFGYALRELRQRTNPVIVETGCMRQEEDYGAGMSTYLFAWFLSRQGGELHSVDINGDNLGKCSSWCSPFAEVFFPHVGDSVSYLREYEGKCVDLLYLDSHDADQPGHAEHCLAEAQAGVKLLANRGMILIDDSEYKKNNFTGKGALAIPWLLSQGFRVAESGWQCLMIKQA